MLTKSKVGFLSLVIFFSNAALSADLEKTVKLGTAGLSLCLNYAEEVGGDVEAFKELNMTITEIAEKMHYTDDLPRYLDEIHTIKKFLHENIMKEHGTKLDGYNNWCIKFYTGIQNGLAKTQVDFEE
ncbi:MAG: hypothetical protein Q7T48_08535 [Cellvibrio sp.]|uniref:hypothetical protein n=1 Tax=Cellvibrio sp. TaxID=1965322 RepID=UPI0027205751|nr:hypothetical protein [Cellvibrio sp.]